MQNNITENGVSFNFRIKFNHHNHFNREEAERFLDTVLKSALGDEKEKLIDEVEVVEGGEPK